MKIVCLIKPSPPLIYFANKINSEFPIALVIIEKPKKLSRSLYSKIIQHGILGSFKVIYRKYFKNGNDSHINDAFFSNQWQTLDSNIAYREVGDINSNSVYSLINEINPDLILDHGTSIVKDKILKLSKLALNLHWGLSPYYRGTHCTDWALVNWDPYNIGVTIHKLTKQIDGGSILAQKRAEIKADDTLYSINMQLTCLGTDLILDAIKKIENGEQLIFEKQDYSKGYLTYQRQWSNILEKQIKYIEKNNKIDFMLRKPSRKYCMPIVEMK